MDRSMTSGLRIVARRLGAVPRCLAALVLIATVSIAGASAATDGTATAESTRGSHADDRGPGRAKSGAR